MDNIPKLTAGGVGILPTPPVLTLDLVSISNISDKHSFRCMINSIK
jgi:hypothetical protein